MNQATDPSESYDARAEITYLSTEAGGRKTGITSGYWSQFHYENEDFSVGQYFPEVGWVMPGETLQVLLRFMRPSLHVGRVQAGTVFLIREGQRTVGYGKITDLLDLEDNARREQKALSEEV